MAQYIDKSALLAEIERLDTLYHTSKSLSGDLFIKGLFCFLDTYKVKEVDLNEEIKSYFKGFGKYLLLVLMIVLILPSISLNLALKHHRKESSMEELDKYFSGELDPKIQYASREQGIKAFAEEYSFNIESELFNQLTKEQQKLWRKEIEQACISGGENGVELVRDLRYKKDLEVKEVDLDYIKDELDKVVKIYKPDGNFGWGTLYNVATHFFELSLKAQKGK